MAAIDGPVYRRAVEAAIWGMPIVSVEAMRRGFFGVGAGYGDIAYLSTPANWRFQITTPNSSSLYVYFNINLSEGPVVLEIPAAVGAGLFGSVMDAWQVPLDDVGPAGVDGGQGGKYLLLPPGFDGEVPTDHYALRSATYNLYAALRAIPATRSDADTAKALALVKQLRLYPLAQAGNPPQQRHLDISGQFFDGIARYDDTFFDSLATMVNEEPVQQRDLAAMGQLRTIGIEKGKEFAPDPSTRTVLRDAIAQAHQEFMDEIYRISPYWPNATWGAPDFFTLGAHTAFSYQTGTFLDVDARGAMFFTACAAPKKLGAATFYLLCAADANGAPLDGVHTYTLRVPPNVPAEQFWAVTVYDVATAAFISESPKTEINSYQDLRVNDDGSVDVYFASSAPAGQESNWVYIAPDKPWFAAFRFYGPGTAVHDKSWVLPNIEVLT
jgi:hypothetical protein